MAVAVPKTRHLAKELWIQGFTWAQISQQLGIKVNTLSGWKQRYSWKKPIQRDLDLAETLKFKDVAERLSHLTIIEAERIIYAIRDQKLVGLRECRDASGALAAAYTIARKALGMDNETGARSFSITLVNSAPRTLDIVDAEVVPEPGPSPLPVVVTPDPPAPEVQ